MILYPSIAILYIGSYYVMNMIRSINIWVFMLLTLGFFVECENRSNIQMGVSTLLYHIPCIKHKEEERVYLL
jgi:hypothetical protein